MPDQSPDYRQTEVITEVDQTDEVQAVAIVGAVAGNFTLEFDGEETGNIPHNASAADVKTALVGLSNIGSSDVTVTAPDGDHYRVTFTGDLGGQDVPALVATGVALENAEEDPVVPVVSTLTVGSAAGNPLAVQIPEGENDGTGLTSANDPDTNPTPAEARADDAEAYGDTP